MAVNGTGSLIVLVTVLIATLTSQAQAQGKPPINFKRDKGDNVSRIIDHSKSSSGEPAKAKKGQFNYMVLMKTASKEGDEEQDSCGGSIIHPGWIMSAAHCITDEKMKSNGEPNGYDITATSVILIAGILKSGDTNSERTHVYTKGDIRAKGKQKLVFIHQDYNKKKSGSNDIVLFKLKKKEKVVNTIELAPTDVSPGDELTASGWGRMHYYIANPWDKLWKLDKCPLVKGTELYNADSIDKCKKDCRNNDDCKVFRYNAAEKKCGLQNCPHPPDPKGNDPEIIGYYLETGYNADKRRKYWKLSQCPFVKGYSLYQASLEKCKDDCSRNDDCKVFRYIVSEEKCGLQNCHGALRKPKGIDLKTIGYYPYSVYKTQQSGQYWETEDCPFVVGHMGSSLYEASLEKCKRDCRNNVACKVFQYKAKERKCGLQYCYTFPDPKSTKPGYIGYDIEEAEMTEELRYVKGLVVITKKDCNHYELSESMFCTKNSNKDANGGDSGGPVTIVSKGRCPQTVQVGIVGSGRDDTYSGIYTNVYKMRKWIYKTMGPDSPSTGGILGPITGGCCTNSRSGSGCQQCLPTSCPDDGSYFTLTVGGPKQCFKVIDEETTWEEANKACTDLGLKVKLAQPLASVQLRSYIVQTYGPDFFVWLGACQGGDPNKMTWKVGGEEIPFEDPLWYPGQPDFDEGCLLLLASEEYLMKEPLKPFWNVLPTYKFRPLCELVLV